MRILNFHPVFLIHPSSKPSGDNADYYTTPIFTNKEDNVVTSFFELDKNTSKYLIDLINDQIKQQMFANVDFICSTSDKLDHYFFTSLDDFRIKYKSEGKYNNVYKDVSCIICCPFALIDKNKAYADDRPILSEIKGIIPAPIFEDANFTNKISDILFLGNDEYTNWKIIYSIEKLVDLIIELTLSKPFGKPSIFDKYNIMYKNLTSKN